MKRVAIVAPQFAPCSYPPAIRVRFFTNHLEEFGWKPLVLTVRPEFTEEPEDPAFARLIPPDLDVIGVKALPPGLTRKVGLGDLGIRCFPYMLAELRRLCREQAVDALFIPGPPWHTFCLGPIIKREFGIPFVLDYIDPWVTPGTFGPLTKAYWFRMMAYLLEPSALRHAAMVTAVSAGTFATLKNRFPFLQWSRFTEIPYGCEESDFSLLPDNYSMRAPWNQTDGKLHVCYVGAVWPQAMDTVNSLLDALCMMRDRNRDLFNLIEFNFFGTSYKPGAQPQVLPLAGMRGLTNVTESPSRVPYLEALAILRSADVILAIGSADTHYTPSKIFPCVLARRPILAVLREESPAVDVVSTLRAGEVVTFNDTEPVETRVESIYEALLGLAGPERQQLPEANLDAFAAYSARSMTIRLAETLDAALASSDPRRRQGRPPGTSRSEPDGGVESAPREGITTGR